MTLSSRPKRQILAPTLRRAYFECRFGQLHVYQAIPPGGGFDELTTLLCLPAPHAAAAVFQPLLVPLGIDRSVFAIDAPGAGQSDPGAANDAAALADAVLDFLHSLRIRSAHVLAAGAAADAVARLLSLAEGRITRVALCDGAAARIRLTAPGVQVHSITASVAALATGQPDAQTQVGQLRAFLDAP